MDTPHILYLIDVLASTYGGAEGALWKMTRLLPADRYHCSVATFSPDPGVVPVDRFSCPVHLLPIQRTYDWNALRMAFRLSRLMRTEKFSIVHTFFPASDILGGVVAKLSGCPVLVSSRRDMGLLRTRAHHVVYRLAGGMFDQVQAVGEQVRRHHIFHDCLDPARVVTLQNGVDLAEIDGAPAGQWPANLDLESGGKVVMCVANIRHVKGLDVLLRTAAIVRHKMPEMRFVVVGEVQEAEYMRSLSELARALDLDGRVVFTGSRTDVPSLLKLASVFYLPSRSEGFSNALLEAMASSLPCVATDVGGNEELVRQGRNGYLVPSEDPDTAAGRILEILSDRTLAERMGQIGRAMAESEFSLGAMMSRLVAFYDGLLGVSRNRQRGYERSVAALNRAVE